eukprot:gene11153-3975_t
MKVAKNLKNISSEEEEIPKIPKNLLPIFVTGGTVDSTLCGWVYFHDLNKKVEDNMEQEEVEEEEEKKQKELTPIFASKSHTASINCLDSYGKMCASGGYDETICIYDMDTRLQSGVILVHAGSIECLKIQSGSHIFIGTSLGQFLCYTCDKNFDCIMKVQGHKGRILSIAIHPSGKAALTVGEDRKLKLWNLSNGSCDFSTTMRNVCTQVEWSPSGDSFSYIKQSEVKVYDTESLELIITLAHEKNVLCLQYITDNLIITGGENKAICIWDIETGELLYKIEDVHTNRIKALSFLEIGINDYIMTSADSDGGIGLWRILNESVSLIDFQNVGVRFTSITMNF